MKKIILIVILLILTFFIGLFGASRISQKQEWVGDARFNYCNFYEEPKCTKWTREYFEVPWSNEKGHFGSCQNWSCFINRD